MPRDLELAMLHGAHSVGDTSEFTLIADANAQKIELKRGTRAWRIHEHREYVGEHWFHMNTTLARTLPLSLRALAHTPPETIDALEAGDTLEVPLDTGGHVVLRKLSHAVCKKKGFPFKKEAAVAWRVSRHVLEDVDARSRHNTRAGKKKKGSSDRETSGPDKTPASKGATSIDPSIFQESATGITQQLALHVHRALNPGTQDLSLDVFVHVSGHAISRVRTPRPSRTEARATRSVDCAIKRGTFRARTRDARQVPLLRRSGRVQLIAYAPPLITAHT